MRYRFIFDKTRLAIFFGGLLITIALTYTAGVFTGLALNEKAKAALVKTAQDQVAQQIAQQAPGLAPAPTPAPASPPQPPAVATPAIPSPVAAKPVPPADVPIVTEADIYSLQVGSFLDAKVARQLQTDLRERGYPAAIFTGVDADHKEWHAVRIGGYATLARASAAASTFTSKERLQALIRRSDSL